MDAPEVKSKIGVSIVEDNSDERALYAGIINEAGDMVCASAHPNSAHALRYLPEVRPDVVLVDVLMPNGLGIECVRQLKALLPKTLPIMLTKHPDDDYVFESLQAGAVGYLLKRHVRDRLPEMIRQACREQAAITPEIARRVLDHFRRRGVARASPIRLTPREEEVLRLVARGFSSKEIAGRLACSANTVDRHVQHICEKLHVIGRVAAASKYFGAQPARDNQGHSQF